MRVTRKHIEDTYGHVATNMDLSPVEHETLLDRFLDRAYALEGFEDTLIEVIICAGETLIAPLYNVSTSHH